MPTTASLTDTHSMLTAKALSRQLCRAGALVIASIALYLVHTLAITIIPLQLVQTYVHADTAVIEAAPVGGEQHSPGGQKIPVVFAGAPTVQQESSIDHLPPPFSPLY